MADILSLDATAQLNALEAGRISAAALLEASIDRYHAVNPALNAVVTTDLDRARRRAQAIDEQRASGEHLGALATSADRSTVSRDRSRASPFRSRCRTVRCHAS